MVLKMHRLLIVLLGALGFVVMMLCYHDILFINLSDSLPKGIYVRSDGIIKRGDYVTSCLNETIASYGLKRNYLRHGWCSTGIRKVVKQVYGLAGDVVERDRDYLKINGEILKSLAISSHDRQGRQLDLFYSFPRIVKPGEYFILSSYVPNSWDSRYIGAVLVEERVEPLFVWR